MNEEQWLPVIGFPGYEVSDQGRVRSYLKMGRLGDQQIADQPQRILRPAMKRYPKVTLYRDGAKCSRRVHHLVALAFLGPSPEGMEICHDDGNKAHCRASNLRYGTRQENVRDAMKHGQRNQVVRKLDLHMARLIRTDKSRGLSNSIIADKYGISGCHVGRIVTEKAWAE